MKKVILLLIIITVCLSPSSALNDHGLGHAAPILLTVYVYDRCGGCGENRPGCGECLDTLRYHSAIKDQFGERLYDGRITYRMYNIRLDANENACVERGGRYGVPLEIMSVRPMIYIGGEDSGVYLPGEGMIYYAGEMLDRYDAGEDASAIQENILLIWRNL